MSGFPCPWRLRRGLVGGLICQAVPNTEEIWRLGPYTFLSTPRWLVRVLRRRKETWEMLPLGACIVLELARQALGHATKIQWLFFLDAGKSWGITLVLLSTVMAVAVPMKIWSNTRLEMNPRAAPPIAAQGAAWTR